MYSAIPLHGLCGVVMDFTWSLFFTAKYKYLILSLIIPYLAHGFYNFLSYPLHFIILGMLAIFTIALHSHFKKLQSEKSKEAEIKKI